MEKEIKIVPPKGYEVDKENSTLECIKFKPNGSWKDSNPNVNGWMINGNRVFGEYLNLPWKGGYLDIFATEKQAKSAHAMAQISQIMANDERFGGPVTDKEWKNGHNKYGIIRKNNEIVIDAFKILYTFLAFHTEEQAKLFYEENKDLVRMYYML